jgi:hypothetical protein
MASSNWSPIEISWNTSTQAKHIVCLPLAKCCSVISSQESAWKSSPSEPNGRSAGEGSLSPSCK